LKVSATGSRYDVPFRRETVSGMREAGAEAAVAVSGEGREEELTYVNEFRLF